MYEFINYTPSGVYSQLSGQLGGMGFTIDETSDGVLTVAPSSYDVLVVNLGSSYYQSYTATEALIIADYVAGGGGLLIMADNPSTPYHRLTLILDAFGLNAANSLVHPDDGTDYTLASHPVFSGVNNVYTSYAGEVSGGTIIAEQPGTPYSKGIMSVMEYGLGRVALIGDLEAFSNDDRVKEDNIVWAENTFNWLVPEPGTLSLMGLAGLAVFRRRR